MNRLKFLAILVINLILNEQANSINTEGIFLYKTVMEISFSRCSQKLFII